MDRMSAGGVDFGLGSSQGQAHSKTLVIRYSTVHIRYIAVYNIRNYVVIFNHFWDISTYLAHVTASN